MMAQPAAGASGATPMPGTALGAAPGEAQKIAGTDLPCGPAEPEAAPFMLALQALATAPDSAGVLPTANGSPDPKPAGAAAANTTAPLPLGPVILSANPDPGGAPNPTADKNTNTAFRNAADAAATGNAFAALDAASPQAATALRRGAPRADGEVLPRDMLRALFTAGATPAASAGTGRTGATGDARPGLAAPATGSSGRGKSKALQDTAQPPPPIAAMPLDPGASLLATVLQWLRQQRDATPPAGAGTEVPASGPEPEDTGPAAQITSAVITAPGIDAASASQAGGHAQGTRRDIGLTVGAQGASPVGAALSGGAQPGIERPGNAPPGITPAAVALPDLTAAQRAAATRDTPDEPSHLPPASDSVANGASAAAGATTAGVGMEMAAALRAATAAIAAPVERSVAVPVHERHWPTALATQVLILSSDKQQAATLRLTPEHLGPVEVRIDMHDAQVNVQFTATHAETRAALEQAMPQLRAVLEGAGLTLGQASVQQQARRESQNSGVASRPAGAASAAPEGVIAVTRATGMIDEFV